MAAKIPYTGVPTVSPASVPTVFQSGRGGTPAAFGALEAEASQRLGATLEQAGNVVAQGALDFQARANESMAREHQLKFDEEIGKIEANFKTLQGRNAVDAYPAYNAKVKETYQSFAKSAPNPAVRRQFEANAARSAGFALRDGASWAGQQNRQYNINTAKATIENSISQALVDPFDEARFANYMTQAHEASRSLSREQGLDDVGSDVAWNDLRSKTWENRLTRMAQTNPQAAAILFERAKNGISPSDAKTIETSIRSGTQMIETRQIADQILATLPKDELQGAKVVQEARRRAEDLHPGDPRFADMVAQRSLERYNQEIKAPILEARQARIMARQDLQDKRETQADTIFRGIQAGKITPEQIVNDPILSPTQKEHYTELLKKSLGESDAEKRTLGPLFIPLYKQILSNTAPLSDADIVANVDKGLTVAGAERLRQVGKAGRSLEGQTELVMQREFLQRVEHLITAETIPGMKDPNGQMNYLKFLGSFLPAYEKARQEGKSPTELLTPDAPGSLWNLAKPFIRTPEQTINDLMRPKPPAQKDYKTSKELKADYDAGRISYDDAAAIIKKKGW